MVLPLLLIVEEGFDVEGFDIHFIEAFFHGGVVDFVGGVGEVAGVASGAAKHPGVWDGADFAIFINGVGTDEELIGLAVDHAVGRSAANGFLTDDHVEVFINLVEFVGRAHGFMRGVGDRPKTIREGDDGTGSAFGFVIEE